MRLIFWFGITSYLKSKTFVIAMVMLIAIGIFSGLRFNLTIGEGIYLNSAYTTGFMTGMLSLGIIFIATVTAYPLLLKEWDTRFDSLLFTTAVTKKQFFTGRWITFFIITLLCFVLLIAGFIVGHLMRRGDNINPSFHLLYYIYPLMIFGVVNSFFICSVLAAIAWISRNKLLMASGGLLIYIAYMVSLIFSNSPFMTNSTPQSLQVQEMAAVLDPFGMSGYFTVSSHYTPLQRNTQLVSLSGVFLLNRLLIFSISCLLLLITYKTAGFVAADKKYAGRKNKEEDSKQYVPGEPKPLFAVMTSQNRLSALQAVLSFLKTDLIYIGRNIPLLITTLFFLFYMGMEFYAEIEKGIRLPQQYAGSGLMAQTINENLHLPGILAGVYFINDICWRSRESRFHWIETPTRYSGIKILGHGITAIVLQLFFTGSVTFLALMFQLVYGYTNFHWDAYTGILLFTTSPMILYTLFALLLNNILPNKHLSLGVTIVVALLLTTSVSKLIVPHPLFRFFTGYKGSYSDFAGYGPYLSWFAGRQLLGVMMIVLTGILLHLLHSRKKMLPYSIAALVLGVAASITALSFSAGYKPRSDKMAIMTAVDYENNYKKYSEIPQPVITAVRTSIHLFPSAKSYIIEGQYTLQNKTGKPVETILFELEEGFSIKEAKYISNSETIPITKPLSELKLGKPLLPGDTAAVTFRISYQWVTVNGHHPFNAIIENGSFMRISRFYPRIGYQKENELADVKKRKEMGLGPQTPEKKLEDSTRAVANFINLDMIISTEEGQTAVGTGLLTKQWKEGKRNYFQYSTEQPVPFRFAVSSAAYEIKKEMHRGITISVLHHPLHDENVEHLIKNAKLTIDYCTQNFGPSPFTAVTFAEVSSFTSGFAATAYPGTIFMTEQMIFHANIKADKQQDVINELAGHELSHQWWGGNQVVPDDREGAAMLTETLAMYTEMMLYKKMYGLEKMNERLKIHQQIYESEKGFSGNEPLYKVRAASTHISYSKGAVIMVAISNIIGEQNVNKALYNFLMSNKYPKVSPVSTDLISELLKRTKAGQQEAIINMLTKSDYPIAP